jgi:hypothetical protein
MAVTIEAVLISLSVNVPILAVAGYILVIIAVSTLSTYMMRGSYTLILLILLFLMWIERQYLLTGGLIIYLGEIGVGLAMLAGWTLRLLLFHEEMPEHSQPQQAPVITWDPTSQAAGRWRRQLQAQRIAGSRYQAWLHDMKFRIGIRWFEANWPFRRLMLRQLAGDFVGLHMIPAYVIFILCFLGMRWLLGASNQSLHGTDWTYVFPICFLAILMSMNLLGGIWQLQRWPYLARESLYPQNRTSFVHDFIYSGLIDMAAAAIGLCGAVALWIAIFDLQITVPLAKLALSIAMILSQFMATGCAMLWLVSFRSFWRNMLGSMMISSISTALIMTAVFSGEWLWAFLAIILTLAAIWGFYRLAVRRWCNIDLE